SSIVPSAHSHACGINELFGGIIDAAAGAAAMGVNVELGGLWFWRSPDLLWWQRQLVTDRSSVIRQHRFQIITPVRPLRKRSWVKARYFFCFSPQGAGLAPANQIGFVCNSRSRRPRRLTSCG